VAGPDLQLPPPSELGARLQAARKSAGKTQDDAAAHLGVARTTITAIEKGQRGIRPGELVQLAGLYGKAVGELVRAGMPPVSLAVQLRASAAATRYDRLVEPYAWELQNLAEDYVELERICGAETPHAYPAERSFGAISPEKAAEDIAHAERARLGLGDGPIASLRDTLEQDVGVRIFYLPMQTQIAAMFAFEPHLGGCIAVNQKHPEARRRMSLAHEYAHFLTSRAQATIDFGARYQRLPQHERFAVAFAPAFLMPATGISRRFNELKARGGGKFTFADLLSLAHYFGVSVEGLVLRLEELRLVRRGLLERAREAGFRPQEGRAILRLVEQTSPSDILPTRYLLLAVQGYRESKITEAQFAKFLRVDLLEGRRVLQDMLGAASGDSLPTIGEQDIDRGIGEALS